MTQVKNSLAEVYHFSKIGHGDSWAIFMVHEESSTLCIESDWGNWAHRWPRHGRTSLKAFIAEGDAGYFKNKLSYGHQEHFYKEATEEKVRLDIKNLLDSGEIDEGEAEEFGGELDEVDCDSSDLWVHLFYETNCCQSLYDYGEIPLKMGNPPALEEFFRHAWPLFVLHMRDTLGVGGCNGQTNRETEASPKGDSA